jgi:hypothetical protein
MLRASRAVAVFTHTDGSSAVETLPSEGQRCTAVTRKGGKEVQICKRETDDRKG